jgi:Protein of unknown function (DUF1571)
MRSFRRFGSGARRHSPRPARRRGPFPLHYYALLSLLGVVVTVGAQTPNGAGYPSGSPAPMGGQAPGAPAAPGTASPIDQATALLNQAAQTFRNVRDYTGVMIKQERVNGQLLPEDVMEIKMRTQPFSVYFRWVAPKATAGQEVCYVAGKNDGNMRVHSKGVIGALSGFISISPKDPRVMQNSRHTITEAGIGNLIGQLQKYWDLEKQLKTAQVRIAEYEYNKRRCTRVEMIRPQNTGGKSMSYRSIVYFDKEYTLPVRVELYDWPRAGGPAGGDLLESYSYVNLRFNVGLTDAVFNH